MKVLEILHFKQECIPVGCLPPAAVAVGGVSTRHPPGSRHPQPCGQTHACRHITLPQTSFAGGKYLPTRKETFQGMEKVTLTGK